MAAQNYDATIEVAQSSKEVFNTINDVTNWWSRDFEGKSQQVGDSFTIHHPNQHHSKQKLVEVILKRRIVWLVTESQLYWLKNNKDEWTNTKIIFDISNKGGKTVLHFTHEGLTPEKECYAMCSKGWDIVIKDWLLDLITTGNPTEAMTRAVEIRGEHFERLISRKGSKGEE